MPESEPKPRPLETVPAGSAQGWKAVLRNGAQVVVHEIPVPPAAAAAAVPRIQRLAEHPHPSLSPILGWGTDANGLWIAVEPNEGTPLSTVLARGRFTPHAASALGVSILSGVAVLHEAGVAMGGFDATAVRITQNGEVRLAGHPVAAVRGAPSQSDLRADVRSSGMAICAAFGVDPAGAPAPPELPPGLVVTMRSMASGAMGPAVDRAQGALREMAGPLMAPDRQLAAQSELALRASGREMPSAATFVQEPPKPAADDMPPPRPASYEPPPRAVSTYAPLPRPQETFTPPPSYAAAPPPPAAPPAAPVPTPAPIPVPEPEPPSAPIPAYEPAEAVEPAAAAPVVSPFAPAEPAPEPVAEPAAAEAAPWTPEPPPEAPAAPVAPFEPAAPAQEVSPFVAAAAAAAEPAAPVAAEPALEWPEPGKPEPAAPPPAPAPAATPSTPAAPREQTGSPTWSPVQTGSWTPGKGHISSSDWTGESTPIPGPVPDDLKEAVFKPSYTPPATYEAAPVEAPAPAKPEPPSFLPAEAPVTTPPIPRAPAPKPSPKPAATRKQDDSGGGPSRRPGWVIPAAIGVVLLLLLGGTGIFLAGKLGSSSTPVAGHTPSTTPTHKASPSPTNVLQQVPVYAPAAAAPVTSVTIDPANSSCTQIGGSCKLEVDIKFSAVQRSNVSFIVKYFDRCTGTTTDLPGAQFTPPGFTLVILDKTDQLPSGAKAAAVVVVTQSPAEAASAPLLLGADSC